GGQQTAAQTGQRGSIRSRLMASVDDWMTPRKPTEFTFKSPVVDTTIPSATLQEPPQQLQNTESEVQTSPPDANGLDGELPFTAEEPVSLQPVPQPAPNAEDPPTAVTATPAAKPPNLTTDAPLPKSSKRQKATALTRKDKARLKNQPLIVRPAKPQDLPQFPHLEPPPNADNPISPEDLELSFERRKLDAESTTQWDIIATKLDGFHRVELPRPKWTWHALTLGDSAVMPKYAREDADYYKGFTMNRVLWDDGVEAITYVGEKDERLKIIQVRTTRSDLRDPLENMIAESAELDLVRPRFAQGKGAGTLAPYFGYLVGEGALEVHPELKPVSFDEIYDKGSMLEKLDQFISQCAAHSCLSAEAEPFDQQLLLLGGADAPAVSNRAELFLANIDQMHS
ncbi:hypothetical protein FRC01_007531, partial [Tulasnella sp. 417]